MYGHNINQFKKRRGDMKKQQQQKNVQINNLTPIFVGIL